ncbi:MAG: FkbM family methyltransferase [Flavobacteriia bacterium]|jgi:FkbM family methyltransferase
MKSIIYRIALVFFQKFPFQLALAKLLRFLRFPANKLYQDLRFTGAFKVSIDKKKSFQLMHSGGTIENEIFWKGLGKTWESHTVWLWIELTKQANVIIDIGANRGVYSLIARTMNPTATIFAFEPSRTTFAKLKENVLLNNYQINCEQLALSNYTGTAMFHDSFDQNQTSATLSNDMIETMRAYDKNLKLNDYEVLVEKLDDFIQAKNIYEVNLIKLDVEMFEPEVIEGFIKFLYLYKPIILIEVLSEQVANRLNELIDKRYLKIHLSDKKMSLKDQLQVVPLEWNYLLVPKGKVNIISKIAEISKIQVNF